VRASLKLVVATALAALGAAGVLYAGAASGSGHGGVRLNQIAGFDQPTYVIGPAGAGGLVFVVERKGTIRMLDGDHKLKGKFLDISDRVACCDGERGLFSVAFAPDYARSGLFYVYFTNRTGDIEIDRFRRSAHSRARADRSSGREVLEIEHSRPAFHNGGQLQFGPDGDLYLATGDPSGYAQDKGSLLGKLLRIDPTGAGKRPYRIPDGNPYAHRKGADEIYSIGLRNPWRFSFDRKYLLIGDVGQESWEEVDYTTVRGARGANFGWNVFEGTHHYSGGSLHHSTKPIFEYSHSNGRCAITGGYVVRDPRLGSLDGRYLYADLCDGDIRSLIPRKHGARGDRSLRVGSHPQITSFGVDQRKRIYVATLGGAVYRLDPR
jgi:hypothetical protein